MRSYYAYRKIFFVQAIFVCYSIDVAYNGEENSMFRL